MSNTCSVPAQKQKTIFNNKANPLNKFWKSMPKVYPVSKSEHNKIPGEQQDQERSHFSTWDQTRSTLTPSIYAVWAGRSKHVSEWHVRGMPCVGPAREKSKAKRPTYVWCEAWNKKKFQNGMFNILCRLHLRREIREWHAWCLEVTWRQATFQNCMSNMCFKYLQVQEMLFVCLESGQNSHANVCKVINQPQSKEILHVQDMLCANPLHKTIPRQHVQYISCGTPDVKQSRNSMSKKCPGSTLTCPI